MLWDAYPDELEDLTLHNAYLRLEGDPPAKTPFFVWLFENPDSPLGLPGTIDLYRHDCFHILLKKGFSSSGEAYVVGFTMGNDPNTHWIHLILFKWVAQFLYPNPYRLSSADLLEFDAGIEHGKTVSTKYLNRISFRSFQNTNLPRLRYLLGI